MNAIRAIHPYPHEGLWILAEIGIQWSAVRCQRRHPEARRAEKRLPAVLPPRSLLAPGCNGRPGRFFGVKVNSSLRCGPVDRIANVVVTVVPGGRARVISRAPA